VASACFSPRPYRQPAVMALVLVMSRLPGVTTDNAAYRWGFNGKGGLGDGTTADALPHSFELAVALAVENVPATSPQPVALTTEATRGEITCACVTRSLS
jgi:hypothetical protein